MLLKTDRHSVKMGPSFLDVGARLANGIPKHAQQLERMFLTTCRVVKKVLYP